MLDVGTGSGYGAAVLAELAREVVSIERIPELAAQARASLAGAGYERVHVLVGDATLGVQGAGPFDAIAVAAAAPSLPEALYEQLVPERAHGDSARRLDRAAARRRRAQPGGSGRAPLDARPLRPADRPGPFLMTRPLRSTAVERSEAVATTPPALPPRQRAAHALRQPHNWIQLAKFTVVGATGYVVNLVVYSLLLGAGMHYLPAAACSFCVAVTNNYLWNRQWTFRGQRGHVAYQGMRFFIVALIALGGELHPAVSSPRPPPNDACPPAPAPPAEDFYTPGDHSLPYEIAPHGHGAAHPKAAIVLLRASLVRVPHQPDPRGGVAPKGRYGPVEQRMIVGPQLIGVERKVDNRHRMLRVRRSQQRFIHDHCPAAHRFLAAAFGGDYDEDEDRKQPLHGASTISPVIRNSSRRFSRQADSSSPRAAGCSSPRDSARTRDASTPGR